jgi:hypothetical protein
MCAGNPALQVEAMKRDMRFILTVFLLSAMMMATVFDRRLRNRWRD